MNIYEFADIIGKDIIITRFAGQKGRFAGQKGRFSAVFRDCEIHDNGFLIGEFGNGVNPQLAVNDYTSRIIGKTLVFDAMDPMCRRDYFVTELVDV